MNYDEFYIVIFESKNRMDKVFCEEQKFIKALIIESKTEDKLYKQIGYKKIEKILHIFKFSKSLKKFIELAYIFDLIDGKIKIEFIEIKKLEDIYYSGGKLNEEDNF